MLVGTGGAGFVSFWRKVEGSEVIRWWRSLEQSLRSRQRNFIYVSSKDLKLACFLNWKGVVSIKKQLRVLFLFQVKWSSSFKYVFYVGESVFLVPNPISYIYFVQTYDFKTSH